MVILQNWNEFEENVILKQKKFYIYGAGKVYQKIIDIIREDVIAVFDKNAKEIECGQTVIVPEFVNEVPEDEVLILCLLNPFEKYMERTREVQSCLETYNVKRKTINLYCLDYETIKKKGILYWNNRELLLDNLLCLVNYGAELPHMKAAYEDVKELNNTYLDALYEEPIEFILYKEEQLGLKEYNNGVIVHRDGKKVTVREKSEDKYEHTIWILGDSRISGMLIENKYTIASYLQKLLDDSNNSYRVVNCGIPGRDIERMVYQIAHENIKEGDYVVLGTGFYEYEDDAFQNVIVWSEYIKDAANKCNELEAKFMYINLPTMLEMYSLSQLEKEMLLLFNTTEFTNYTHEKIKYYKNILQYMCQKNGISYYDFANVFQGRHEYGHVFINLHHYGPKGNRLIADRIFGIFSTIEMIEKTQQVSVEEAKAKRTEIFNQKIEKLRCQDEELLKYIHEIKKNMGDSNFKGKRVGSIVMNANPFTKGHLHLTQIALEQVDFLIVFVVSEDESFFSFEDRFNLVRDNLAEYENVIVVPSGKFCISKATFPEYFKKADIQDERVDVKNDLEIFADKIAPALNISVRFVGEEKEDKITNQYNEAMKRLLPLRNIEVVEIPRKLLDNKAIISASSVRKLIKENNISSIKEIVPEKTYEFIKLKYGKR